MQGVLRSSARQLYNCSSRRLPNAAQSRPMSGAASIEEEVKEMNKWRIVTIVAIPFCIGLALWDLSAPAEHAHERPAYSYLRIRNKEFPWGECGLFEMDCGKHGEHEEE